MSLADLVAAGAPELPDGWFYRVRESALHLHVEIRERRFVGSRLVAKDVVLTPFFPDQLDGIVDTCRKLRTALDRAADRAQYLGDHDGRRMK